MNVTQDLSILHLILEASAVVQIVMALLAAVSCMSWYYIFMKWFSVRQARAKTETFERDFWSGGDLNNLFNSAVNDRHHAGSMERIFEAGFREFTKLKGQKNLDSKGNAFFRRTRYCRSAGGDCHRPVCGDSRRARLQPFFA